MSAAPVRFLFDYISPNAYLAWECLDDLAARRGRAVEPVPVLFAGLLNAHGLVGPAEAWAKWAWMMRDILYKARAFDIRLEPPPSHPFNPLLALRVTSLPMDPATRHRLIGALFRAHWAGGPGITDPAAVARIATGAGLDGARAVAHAGEDAIKRRVREQTEAAVEAGVFGVPTMLVDGQLFWGFDDFPKLDRFLGGLEPPIEPERWRAWCDVQPTADRRAGRDSG